MNRFGLCCQFVREPIRFRHITAKTLSRLSRRQQLERLDAVCLHNGQTLLAAIGAVVRLGIGAFRIPSPLLPRYTHPEVGYDLSELPSADCLVELLVGARTLSEAHRVRLSLHPDQFTLLSSPRADVIANSLQELEYQGLLAEYVGADVINLHAGGGYGNKAAALRRLKRHYGVLSERVRRRLTLENDDRVYGVADLLPVCQDLGIPLVYDVHHHRCHPDGLTVEEATHECVKTWQVGREPYVHLSSPRNGWKGGNARPHADYIDPADYPDVWGGVPLTVDVEAKAKELAVHRLRVDLGYTKIKPRQEVVSHHPEKRMQYLDTSSKMSTF